MAQKANKEFLIEFNSLKEGSHFFELKVADKFFDSFEYSDIRRGALDVVLNLEKKDRMLVFNFSITGYVSLPCDLCLDYVNIDINTNPILYVKFGENYTEEAEDIIIIPDDTYSFDCQHYVYEYIHLALPMKRTHPSDDIYGSKCNKSMLEKLEALNPKVKKNTLNAQNLEILKKIKFNLD